MAKENVSRRNFLATLAAAGAMATSQTSPLAGLASPPQPFKAPEFKTRSADEPLRIVSTTTFTQAEAAQIKEGRKKCRIDYG